MAEVLIVGGGPAGMMAGYLLARAGVSVRVLEKHQDFFRDFRGDTVHPSTTEILDQLGLLERFLQRPHDRLDKARIRVAGQGGPGLNGGPNGDVYLRVSVADDPRFERQGDDLRTEVPVPLYTALLGGEVVVNTPTGKVALTIPAETPSGKVFRLRGKGMPKRGSGKGHGDLLARVSIILPDRLTDQERELFSELRSLRAKA